jgi:hypothetical protein
MSASGQYVFIQSDYIWRSTDYGVTFTRLNSTSGYVGRAMVYLGNTNTAFIARYASGDPYNTQIWQSSDYGATWTYKSTRTDGGTPRNGFKGIYT